MNTNELIAAQSSITNAIRDALLEVEDLRKWKRDLNDLTNVQEKRLNARDREIAELKETILLRNGELHRVKTENWKLKARLRACEPNNNGPDDASGRKPHRSTGSDLDIHQDHSFGGEGAPIDEAAQVAR